MAATNPRKKAPRMSITDSIRAQSPETAAPRNTNVTARLSPKAHGVVREIAAETGLSMASVAREIIHAALAQDGYDVADDDSDSDAGE